MKAFEKFSMPFGMAGAAFYLLHTILGNILWPEYDPMTMDISSLTAVGAPNADLLRIFTTIYGVCTILFVAGLIIKSFRTYHAVVRAGYIVLLVMQSVSLFGYALFPLTGDKTTMNFQNMMHIVVTVVVVLTTISSGFILAFGYIRQEKMARLGRFVLIMAIIITIAGSMNPILMGAGANLLGLTERLVIYSLQFLMFSLSFYYTFEKRVRKAVPASALQ